MKFHETLQNLNNQIICAKFFTDTSFAFNYLNLKDKEYPLTYVDRPYENILIDLFGNDYQSTASLSINTFSKVVEYLYEVKRLISSDLSSEEYHVGKLIAQATEYFNENPFKVLSVPQVVINPEMPLYTKAITLHKLLQRFIKYNENAINVPNPVYNFTDSLAKHHHDVISWTIACYSEIYRNTHNLFNRVHETAWNQLYDTQID